MQVILFLLGLFAIGCVLYGIAAGVQLIRQGVSGLLRGAQGPSRPAGDGVAASAAVATTAAPPVAPSPVQHGIAELRALHALHQQGALTLAEFEGLKRTVLAGIATSDIQTQPGTP